MFEEKELADYLDGALSPGECAAVEVALESDPVALREVISQQSLEQALRVVLAGGGARVRASVLAEVGAPKGADGRRRILEFVKRPAAWNPWRIAGGGLAAAAAIMLLAWVFSPRSHSRPMAGPLPSSTPISEPLESVPAPLVATVSSTPESVPAPAQSPLPDVMEEPSPPSAIVQATPEPTPVQVAIASPTPGQMAASQSSQTTQAEEGVSPEPLRLAERDLFSKPFASESPWNRALGSQATYEAVAWAAPSANGEVRLARRPIYKGLMGQPVDIRAGGRVAGQVRIPTKPDLRPFADMPLCIGDGEGFLWELARPELTFRGLRCREAARVDLRGGGFHGGLGQYGGSAMGGVIRDGELSAGIPHALALGVNTRLLNSRGGDGRAFVWPATGPLQVNTAGLGGRGNVLIGTLLALPPEVDIAQFGPAREIARALQDYGTYVTQGLKRGGFEFYVAGDGSPELREELEKMVSLLKVVANNVPSTPGGGGEPRRPAAPPFRERR